MATLNPCLFCGVHRYAQGEKGKGAALAPAGGAPALAPGKAAEGADKAAEPVVVKKSTLNPFAKSFTLNVNAKEFTPSFVMPKPAPPQAPPPIHMQQVLFVSQHTLSKSSIPPHLN